MLHVSACSRSIRAKLEPHHRRASQSQKPRQSGLQSIQSKQLQQSQRTCGGLLSSPRSSSYVPQSERGKLRSADPARGRAGHFHRKLMMPFSILQHFLSSGVGIQRDNNLRTVEVRQHGHREGLLLLERE
eukprot:GDKK01004517.1.p1 GENE.GDKK01004517.1~~GDKK01004517.1.p1  ORF type:complete len:130 (+),score=14.82 GDKK01004517.1:194-583(+)